MIYAFTQQPRRFIWNRHSLLIAALLLNACGGGSSGTSTTAEGTTGDGPPIDDGTTDGNTTGEIPNNNVTEVLESFGVDTTPTPRLDNNGEDLPEDYSPLGTNTTVSRFEEAILFGASISPDAALANVTGGLNPVIDFDLVGTTSLQAEVLADEPTSTQPWFTPNVIHGVTSGDINADGLDEMIVAWQSENDAPVELSVVNNLATGATMQQPLVIASGVVAQSLTLLADDLDGDGSIDLAVAITDDSDAIELITFVNDSGVLNSNGNSFSIPAQGFNGYTHFAMTSGNVDRDDAREIALTVNRYEGEINRRSGNNQPNATSEWVLLDDTKRGLAQLAGGQSVINTEAGPIIAKVADIALGDVDGDSVDEIILGGLTAIGAQGFSGVASPEYLIEVKDDSRFNYTTITGLQTNAQLPRSQSGSSQFIYYMFVRTGDFDDDGAEEILTNQFVWDDIRSSGGTISPLLDEIVTAQTEQTTYAQVENTDLLAVDGESYYLSPVHASIDVGDLNGDDRDDIAIWSDKTSRRDRLSGLAVYGLSMDMGFRLYTHIETNSDNSTKTNNNVVLLGDYEINGDTAALRLSNGSYRYDLTEPVVLAVLVAAPCSEALGQDLSSCRTGIGSTISTGSSETSGWTVSIGGSAGWDARDPITQTGGSIIAKANHDIRNYETTAYQTTISVLRETGPIEDTVIFTTIPFDVWSYEVLSHPDPSLIGRTVEVRLPRKPIDIMTTRSIYNQNTAPDALKIDDQIVSHTPGDPGSYPTATEAAGLLQRYKGIKTDAQTVGLNTGRQTVTIDNFTETTDGRSYATMGSVEFGSVAGGFVMTVEIGGGTDSDISSTKGEGTFYQGQVAEIGPENPISASYEFGLFTYIYEPGGDNPPFEIINYWVSDF